MLWKSASSPYPARASSRYPFFLAPITSKGRLRRLCPQGGVEGAERKSPGVEVQKWRKPFHSKELFSTTAQEN